MAVVVAEDVDEMNQSSVLLEGIGSAEIAVVKIFRSTTIVDVAAAVDNVAAVDDVDEMNQSSDFLEGSESAVVKILRTTVRLHAGDVDAVVVVAEMDLDCTFSDLVVVALWTAILGIFDSQESAVVQNVVADLDVDCGIQKVET